MGLLSVKNDASPAWWSPRSAVTRSLYGLSAVASSPAWLEPESVVRIVRIEAIVTSGKVSVDHPLVNDASGLVKAVLVSIGTAELLYPPVPVPVSIACLEPEPASRPPHLLSAKKERRVFFAGFNAEEIIHEPCFQHCGGVHLAFSTRPLNKHGGSCGYC